jgi:hypothetical protein
MDGIKKCNVNEGTCCDEQRDGTGADTVQNGEQREGVGFAGN